MSKARISVVERCFDAALTAVAGEAPLGEARPGEARPGETQSGAVLSADARLEEAQAAAAPPGDVRLGEARSGAVLPTGVRLGEARSGAVLSADARLGEARSGALLSADARLGGAQPGVARLGAVGAGDVQPGAARLGAVGAGDAEPGAALPREVVRRSRRAPIASGDGATTGGAVLVGAGGAVAGAANEPRRFYMTREHHPENGTLFGFWLYLMSDCLVFACLFAAYAVLGRSYAGGPTGGELFDLPLVAVNTSLLLLSSITYGFAMLEMQRSRLPGTLAWLAITGLLGAGFIGIELTEFAHLIHEGAGPQRSAFLSSFFTLVGTHGLHVTFGIVWLITLMVQSAKHGLIPENRRRLMCLSMFWHFLDVVWIGVFTFVYLMGTLP